MRPSMRAGASELVTKLRALDKLCRDDPDYARKRTKNPPRRACTNLSHLVGNSGNISHGQETQAKADPMPALLPGMSEITITRDSDAGPLNEQPPRDDNSHQGSLEPYAALDREPSSRSGNMEVAKSAGPASVNEEPDAKQEPNKKGGEEGGRITRILPKVWSAFRRFICCYE